MIIHILKFKYRERISREGGEETRQISKWITSQGGRGGDVCKGKGCFTGLTTLVSNRQFSRQQFFFFLFQFNFERQSIESLVSHQQTFSSHSLSCNSFLFQLGDCWFGQGIIYIFHVCGGKVACVRMYPCLRRYWGLLKENAKGGEVNHVSSKKVTFTCNL